MTKPLMKGCIVKMEVVAMMVFAISMGTTALGAEKTKALPKRGSTEISVEQRKNMSTAHEKMAACLNSDKSFDSCQKEMMQTCQDTMGKDGCPMMGKMHGMMGKGMMQGRGMMDKSGSKSDTVQPEDAKKQAE